MSGIAKMEASRVRRDSAGSLEIDRITRLPLCGELPEEVVEEFSRQEIDAGHFEKGFRFRPLQAKAILDYDTYGGVLAPIPVGKGKTLVTLVIADRAFRAGIERSFLLVPPDVYSQLTKVDISWTRKRINLRVPFILMGGKTIAERRRIMASRKRGCYIMPHTSISNRDATDLLNGLMPGLFIIDEAHKFKRRTATRTKRLFGKSGYITKHQPQLVALSGTMTSKSLRDYGHFAAFALRERSPLPMDVSLIDQWAQVIDSGADPADAQTGPIRPLLTWFRTYWPDEELPPHVAGYRHAYLRRFSTCPGVVQGNADDLGVSLNIRNTPVANAAGYEGHDTMVELMKQVEELWLTPSGDEIDYGFHKWRYLFELSSGFYFNQVWPSVEELSKRSVYRGMSGSEIEGYLLQAKMHHEALQEYHRRLRKWLQYCSKPHLDSPMLVGKDMALHGPKNVGHQLFEAWQEARDLAFDHMPERQSIPVKVCDYKIQAAVKWAEENGPGLVWYHHNPLGEWAAQAMIDAGIDAAFCPAESRRKGMNDFVIDPRNKGKVLVVAMGGHGTGKNLQHSFHKAYFLQFPRPCDTAEQVIGRTHREGQPEDEVIVTTCNTTLFDHLNMGACLVDALYEHQSIGSQQKVIYATYDPLPHVYPDDFLRERGFKDVKKLAREERRELEERFGAFQKVT